MPLNVHDVKSQIVIDESFHNVVGNLEGVEFPDEPVLNTFQSLLHAIAGTAKRIEHSCIHNLNPENGMKFASRNDIAICAYNESRETYRALEGDAVCTSHSLVFVTDKDYISTAYVTLRFFTRSELVVDKMKGSAIKTSDILHESAKLAAEDRIGFLRDECINNSILLMEGSPITGDTAATTPGFIEELNDHSIVPIFFVKDNSSVVTDSYDSLRGKYNSDIHWSNSVLKEGQRTDFFEFVDERNDRNAMVFCYVKCSGDSHPIRLEIPRTTFEKVRSLVDELIDLSYYLLILQGDEKNPQPRPIAIAERYSLEILKMVDITGQNRLRT